MPGTDPVGQPAQSPAARAAPPGSGSGHSARGRASEPAVPANDPTGRPGAPGGPADPTGWRPANELEAGLAAALQGGDAAGFGRWLRSAELLLPVPEAAAAGREPVPWALTTVDGRRCVVAFTSPEALLVGTAQRFRHHRSTAFRDLVAAWPDPQYGLLLDPLTPLQLQLAAADLVRLGAAPLADLLDDPGDAATPASGTVLQKTMSVAAARRLLAGNEGTVSGYAVRLEEIAHLDTLDALLAGLPLDQLDPDIEPDARAVYALRWLVVGAGLYPVAADGPGADRPAAASWFTKHASAGADWFTESPPIRGTGFVPGVQPAVQLYRVPAVHLPHGSELVRISAADPAHLVAYYDADDRTWAWDPALFAGPDPDGGEP